MCRDANKLRLASLDLLQLGRLPGGVQGNSAEIGQGAQPCDCGGIDGKRVQCVEM